jgi:hypothetical protein
MSTYSTYNLSREDIEKYSTIGFHLAIDNMLKNEIITKEQAEHYQKFACVVITRETVYEKLKKFFVKGESGFDTVKVIAVPLAGDTVK